MSSWKSNYFYSNYEKLCKKFISYYQDKVMKCAYTDKSQLDNLLDLQKDLNVQIKEQKTFCQPPIGIIVGSCLNTLDLQS